MTSPTHPQKNCFHCGLEVPEHLHLTVRFEDEEHETCCAGCQAVAQSIIDAGLGNYYKQRTADAEKSELPPPEVLSQLKLYDLPEVQADFVEVGAGDEREAVLMLGGITCAACVWLIEQQLLRMKGVVRVDLNYSTHRCRVVWDSAHIELSDILLKIRQTGYTAAPYDAQKIEAQAQKERKQFIVRLAVAGLGMMQTMMFALPTYFYGGDIEPLYLEILHWGGFLMVLPVVFYSALPFYRGAWRDWKNRRVGMDTPIAIAIVMTFIAGIYSLATNAGQGMYFESIAMLLFFLLGGRFMEQIARRKAGDAAERLVKLVPAFCHRLPSYPESEAIEEAAVVRLNIGDTIVVKPGEVIPVDGTVLSGESEVNEAMLTGESLPIVKRPSEKVTAGTLNTSSPLIIRTDHTGGNTRLSHIVKLLDRLERFITEPASPSLLHGDLWSGNLMCDSRGKAMLIDPACYCGNREADIAMTELFGGFPRAFYDAYNEAFAFEEGREERRDLYNLYHLLNHLNLFGRAYFSAVCDIVNEYV